MWFGGGKLAADLSLPKLRCRWGAPPVGARPDARFTPAERNAIWEHAASAARNASDQIRYLAATDPAAASDAAYAASDTLHAAASALGSRVVRQAADAYARAARMPYARIPRQTPVGDSLRRAARLLSVAAYAGDPAFDQVVLILRLAELVKQIAELREWQRRAAQAAAARHAVTHLRAAARACQPQPTAARAQRAARLAALEYPSPPRPRPPAHGGPGRHEPAWPGHRPWRGPAPPRPRGPAR